MNFKNVILEKKKWLKKVHTILFHLYEFLEEARVIYNENADPEVPGWGSSGLTDCKEAQSRF